MNNLIINLNVRENVEIPMYETKLSSKEIRDRALELLKTVDLADKVDQNPTKLSGGKRQRVAISRALINYPSIIYILKLLKDLHMKEHVTLALVTYEPYVADMADRIQCT
jgi:putative ABC transport system ATP-binding protein